MVVDRLSLGVVATLRRGRVLWGWPYCVQDRQMTQFAIDRGLTLIALEAMHHWTENGSFSDHVFHKNNELAGYGSVLHAMQLLGITVVPAASSVVITRPRPAARDPRRR